MAYMLIFLLKKMWVSFCICKSYSHFFSKNNCELDIVLTRTVNILTTNKLVKLTMLWTTGPWYREVNFFTWRSCYIATKIASMRQFQWVSTRYILIYKQKLFWPQLSISSFVITHIKNQTKWQKIMLIPCKSSEIFILLFNFSCVMSKLSFCICKLCRLRWVHIITAWAAFRTAILPWIPAPNDEHQQKQWSKANHSWVTCTFECCLGLLDYIYTAYILDYK